MGAPVSVTTTIMLLAVVPVWKMLLASAAAAASVLSVMTGCAGEWPWWRCVTATRRHDLASLPYLVGGLDTPALACRCYFGSENEIRKVFRKVGAPDFRKKGKREKKEKIDESKKKMELYLFVPVL